ncbi:TAD2A protein, partial [Polypterus senegalus]
MLQGGMRTADVARAINCHVRTVRRLRQRYRETGRTADHPRSRRPRVTTPAQDQYIRISHLRDRIIRDHGLINLRKFQIEFELRREIKKLQEYRRMGIQTFCSAKVFDRLSRSREEEKRKRSMLSEVLQYIQDGGACQRWLCKQAAITSSKPSTRGPQSNQGGDPHMVRGGRTPYSGPPRRPGRVVAPGILDKTATGRRHAPPLNLTGLPGTDKLNDKEKELCQVVRLVPGAYLEYKAALVNECRRQGGLRLAQARSLIKIDVNKTRKIYDFLLKEGYISKA